MEQKWLMAKLRGNSCCHRREVKLKRNENDVVDVKEEKLPCFPSKLSAHNITVTELHTSYVCSHTILSNTQFMPWKHVWENLDLFSG